MTGTGTSTDPYIVDNWTDFLTAVGTNNAYVEMDRNATNKIIDVSAEHNNWFTDIVINFSCKYLKGNGWTLRNIVVRNSYIFNMPGKYLNNTIDNLNITNCYVLSGAFINASTVEGSIEAYMNNCKISVFLNNSKFISSYRGSCTFTNCALNIRLKDNACFNINIYSENNNIYLTGDSTNTTPIDTILGMSKITGNLTLNAASQSSISITSGSLYNVLDMNIICNSSSGVKITNKGQSLVNKDKISGTFTITDNTFAVTNEQLIDADYLESIGFLIGGNA